MTVAARITCETLPGLLRDFCTASDKSCGRGLGTRLGLHTVHPESTGGYIGMFQCSNSATIMSHTSESGQDNDHGQNH